MANLLSLSHFITKVGGVSQVYQITQSINNGARQAEVAEAYDLDPGYLSRIISNYFVWYLTPQEDTLEYLNSHVSQLEECNAESGRVQARIYDLAAGGRALEEAPRS